MKSRVTLASALAFTVVTLLYQAGCGSSSPTAPGGGGGGGGTGTGGTASVIITIVGQNGNQSFSPNPATVDSGQTVAWRNADSTVHHVVEDSGAFDTGDIAPGATSAPITVGSGALSYHCSIHPTMVGGLNGSSGNAPTGPGCDHRH
jgi:plastocyanin